jgi:3-oxoacyl-[acyl-carrier protein] reductase
MMFDLTGMTALVTGASGGLGGSIAKALSVQGARLAAFKISSDERLSLRFP